MPVPTLTQRQRVFRLAFGHTGAAPVRVRRNRAPDYRLCPETSIHSMG